MIISYDFFGYEDGTLFDSNVSLGTYNRLELKNGKFDEVKIDEEILAYDSGKKEWGYYTVFKAEFKNDLEAGNVNLNGVPIIKFKLQKRKSTELLWQDVKEFDFDINIQQYVIIDKFVESGETYEYSLMPVGAGEIYGDRSTLSVDCEFENTWIFDKDIIYQLLYNLEYSEIENIQKSVTFETLGSQYPIIVDSDLDYRQSSIKAMLVSNGSMNGNIDVKQEKLNRKQIVSFLKSRQPKILKDGGGNYILVKLSNVKEMPKNEFNQRLYDISFSWTEIGDALDDKTLRQNNLLD